MAGNDSRNQKLSKQRCDYAGNENAIERTRAADRSEWCAEPGNIFDAQQIGADQHAQGAADVSEWRALLGADEYTYERCADRRDQNWHGDSKPWNRAAEIVTDDADDGDAEQCREYTQRTVGKQKHGQGDGYQATAEVNANLRFVVKPLRRYSE